MQTYLRQLQQESGRLDSRGSFTIGTDERTQQALEQRTALREQYLLGRAEYWLSQQSRESRR